MGRDVPEAGCSVAADTFPATLKDAFFFQALEDAFFFQAGEDFAGVRDAQPGEVGGFGAGDSPEVGCGAGMATSSPADTGSTQVTWPWCGGKLSRLLSLHP
jgi:hypothetical protein